MTFHRRALAALLLVFAAVTPAAATPRAADPGAWPWQLGEFPWQTGGIVHLPPPGR